MGGRKWVMSHAQATDGIKSAVRRVRSIEHGIYLDDEAIEMRIERGTHSRRRVGVRWAFPEAADRGINVPEYAHHQDEDGDGVHRDLDPACDRRRPRSRMGTDSGVMPHGQNLRRSSGRW